MAKAKEKVKISTRELYNEIWKTSLSQTADKYGVAYAKLKAICEKEGVKLPDKEYVLRKKFNKPVEAPQAFAGCDKVIEIEKIVRRKSKERGVATTKASMLCIYEILKKYTDYDHRLNANGIIKKLKRDYNIELERKTIYDSLDMLREMYYGVSKYDREKDGYYLEEREFDTAEVKILMDCVYSNIALDRKLSKELIEKLQQLLPEHKRKYYNNLRVVGNERKNNNIQVFSNIEIIDEAITKRKKISFTYLQYNINKELSAKSDKKYIVSPYGLVSTNEAYYLIGKKEGSEGISHYRIDRMVGVTEIEGSDAEKPPKGFDISNHIDKSTFMFGGKTVKAEFRCKGHILGNVIDKFGHGIRLKDNKDGTFKMTVTASFEGLAIWAVHYLDACEVVEPEELRDKVIDMIKKNMYGLKLVESEEE